MSRVAITIDFEPDCPPYLSSSFRGITEGAPRLLALFRALGIPATYFTTGEVAERYPAAVHAVVDAGHELGCHGWSHTAFDRLDEKRARREIETSATLLRAVAPVTSFRAPYLRFPERYVGLLEDNNFRIDSSLARYKRSYRARRVPTSLTRIAASTTSSVLRLPALIRDPLLLSLADPVVLFVHPWEFVDLRKERLRLDCRFRTGDAALHRLRTTVELFQRRGAHFVRMRDLARESVA